MKRYEPNLMGDMLKRKRGDWVKHDQAHVLLKEAYESIVENHKTYEGDRYEECIHCLNGGIDITHQPDCIVLKATKYLEGEG